METLTRILGSEAEASVESLNGIDGITLASEGHGYVEAAAGKQESAKACAHTAFSTADTRSITVVSITTAIRVPHPIDGIGPNRAFDATGLAMCRGT